MVFRAVESDNLRGQVESKGHMHAGLSQACMQAVLRAGHACRSAVSHMQAVWRALWNCITANLTDKRSQLKTSKTLAHFYSIIYFGGNCMLRAAIAVC